MSKPRILVFDIETAPSLGWVWGKYKQYVNDFHRDWYMLSFAYKWVGNKTVRAKALPDYKTFKRDRLDDTELIKDLWELFDKADIIIGHNIDKFDIKKSNTRFLLQGLQPPEPYQTVDTYKIAKKHFGFTSNKLDDIAEALGFGNKDQVDFQLWIDCINGDKKAWRKMVKYNKKDVDLTEKVYMTFRAWSSSHPNMSLMQGKIRACTKCGSYNLQKRGPRYTKTRIYQRWRCNDCGGWSQSRTSSGSGTEVK